MLYTTITTIQPPTRSVSKLMRHLEQAGGHLVVAGDKKGPESYNARPGDRVTFLSFEDQLSSEYQIVSALPAGHYTRKNIAYLKAIAGGASCIYDTDDDNAPNGSWGLREECVEAREVPLPGQGPRWVNVYAYFSPEQIWPRGLPLNEIRKTPPQPSGELKPFCAPVQQGLANGSPDVDAVWRLVLDRPFDFNDGPSVYLSPGNWCPFNTQSTWWWPRAYPLLYIPSYCSFRMCDIWKSFVTQRCLWAMGHGVVFHAPEVDQDRNEHNLLKDFEDEVPGYLKNPDIVEILDGLTLEAGPDTTGENLKTCYRALVEAGIFPVEELKLVDLWLADISRMANSR